MGRRKIEIKPITDDRNRSVTFLKRKGGLFKKAHELSVLCSVDVAVIVFGHNKKVYEYSSRDIQDIIRRFGCHPHPHEHKGPADFSSHPSALEDDDDDAEPEDAAHSADARSTPRPESQQRHRHQRAPDMMPPPMQNHMQNHPGFQRLRQSTPSASPPALPRSRPSSRTSQRGGAPVDHVASEHFAPHQSYTSTPPYYTPPAPHAHMSRPSPAYPPGYPPPAAAAAVPAMPPGYPRPASPGYGRTSSPPQHHHHYPRASPPPPGFPMHSPAPPSRHASPALHPPARYASPGPHAPKPLAPAAHPSIFTPIDDSRSMLAANWGSPAHPPNSMDAMRKPDGSIARSQSIDVAAMQRPKTASDFASRRVSPRPPALRQTSSTSSPALPGSAGRNSLPASHPYGDPPLSARPRLRVEIPAEHSDDEAASATPTQDPGSAVSSVRPGAANNSKATSSHGHNSAAPSHAVVLPPPSPSAGALVSAGAQGPPNPFARPPPPVSHARESNPTSSLPATSGPLSAAASQHVAETPMSALPSRFMSDNLLPSPSTFYPEWNLGRSADGGSMLPSPMTFGTPVAGEGRGWQREEERERSRERERERKRAAEDEAREREREVKRVRL